MINSQDRAVTPSVSPARICSGKRYVTDESPRVAADILNINTAIIPVFHHFFNSFNETNLVREIWLAYPQGFTN